MKFRRSRALASDDRLGAFSRRKTRARLRRTLRALWLQLAVLLLLPVVVSLPFMFVQHGAGRWFVAGLSVATGVWLVVLMVVFLSGTSNQFMSVIAERWTAIELRRLCRDGWKLANGLRIRGSEDIDHLLVGPTGVWAFETKWSAEPWMNGGSDRFMDDRLRKAIEQVSRNAKDVGHQFGRQLAGDEVHRAVVLWSSPNDRPSDERWSTCNGVFVVAGPVLRDWLDSVVRSGSTSIDVRQMWTAVERHAGKRDASDATRGIGFQSTLQQLFWQRAVVPVLAALVAAYAFFATSRNPWWPLVLVETAVALVLGALASRTVRLRWAALGWLAGTVAALLTLVAVVVA